MRPGILTGAGSLVQCVIAALLSVPYEPSDKANDGDDYNDQYDFNGRKATLVFIY